MNAASRRLPKGWLAAHSLWLALGVSLLLHGLVLSLHFQFPDASRALKARALDIILVNSRSARRPSCSQDY